MTALKWISDTAADILRRVEAENEAGTQPAKAAVIGYCRATDTKIGRLKIVDRLISDGYLINHSGPGVRARLEVTDKGRAITVQPYASRYKAVS